MTMANHAEITRKYNKGRAFRPDIVVFQTIEQKTLS